ncbi:glycoside/pentoside/hexuronide:cation symporter, GPH family [Sphingobium sp. YG1]|jgi:GPH family glycoside/pentoside/hexuronide:cation symporter|nr:glycoside/pentoside/hexuronide:cation symporter, GPH family [Sphingobium sp. YG1]
MRHCISPGGEQSSMTGRRGQIVASLSCIAPIGPDVTQRRLLPIIFGMTHAGKSLLWAGADAFTLFILIKVLDIPPVMAGTLFVLSSFWNAMVDGIWGHIVNRRMAIRAMLPGVCGLAAGLGCLSFAILPWLPAGIMPGTIFALFLFRTTFSLIDVPHNATAAALANIHGHLSVARWRSILSALTAIMVAAAALPMTGAATMVPHMARMIFPAIALMACLLLAPLPWLIRMTRQATPVSRAGRLDRAKRVPMRGLGLFCLSQMLGFAALACMGKAMLHTGALEGWLLDYALLILTIVRLAAVGLWSPIAAHIGSAKALSLAYICSALSAITLPAAIGQGGLSAAIILGLLGLSLGGVILLAWSSFSEQLPRWGMADDPAAAVRAYGWFTATAKVGLGFSGLFTGAWLGQVGGGSIWALWLLVMPVALLCVASASMAWCGWRFRMPLASHRLEPA